MMNTGIVFDIQRFCLNDGPGIRTTVFLKGCPLSCIWCHNPEAMQLAPQMTVGENPRLLGQEMSVEEVLNIAARDQAYYSKSGGGLTISGGEPMMQFPFTLALLKEAKKQNWHTCLDTSGFASQKSYENVLQYVDLFLFDIKAHDNELHRQLTGQGNGRLLANLDYLYQNEAAIILRCPLIPNVNDSEAHLEFIAGLYHQYPKLRGIELMPYHNMASKKWSDIGLPFALKGQPSASSEDKSHWLNTLQTLRVQSVRLG